MIHTTSTRREVRRFKNRGVGESNESIIHIRLLILSSQALLFFRKTMGKVFFSTPSSSYYFIWANFSLLLLLRCFALLRVNFKRHRSANSSKKMISSLRFFTLSSTTCMRVERLLERIKNMIAIIFASDEIYSEPASLI